MDPPVQRLLAAADRWGTPLYITDLDLVARHLAAYAGAFPGALIAYAVKANPDPQLLRRLAREGAGAEVVTAVELALATRAGIPGKRIVMNGVGKRDEEIHLALAAGALVNAESLEELHALLRLAADHPGARIGLRLNPGLAADTHPHLATGALGSKFGIALEDLPLALGAIRTAGAALHALGAHIGSAIESADAFSTLAARLADAAEAAEAFGLPPVRIDLGGGLREPDAGSLVAAVTSHFPDPARLILEPGRSLVADAGWLVTRVVRVQPRPATATTFLVADAGMNDLIRPVLYGAVHPVSLVAPGQPLPEGHGTVHLAGPVCEAGDVLARDLAQWIAPDDLRRAGSGALLAIGQAGAYGAAMASVYNGRLRPAEAVLEDGALRLSRRRETLDDLIARDEPPER
ncbi:MAG TPA: diaminopimelate decarboxylase [candidate division Zixibacteria bacterium]|nr:diaminopimelate decarboxylase [candidate division Zixibacteria bacterium]